MNCIVTFNESSQQLTSACRPLECVGCKVSFELYDLDSEEILYKMIDMDGNNIASIIFDLENETCIFYELRAYVNKINIEDSKTFSLYKECNFF